MSAKATKRMSQGLDYNIPELDTRMNIVGEILNNRDNELLEYYDEYYNPSINQNGKTSEHDFMSMDLSRLADYILYSDKKDQKSNGEKGNNILVQHQLEYRYKNEMTTDDVSKSEDSITNLVGANNSNYYLENKTAITDEDRMNIPEIKANNEFLGYLRLCVATKLEMSKLKKHPLYEDIKYENYCTKSFSSIKMFGASISDDIKKEIRLDNKTLSFYKKMIKEINADEVLIKEKILGVIRFKRITKSDYIPSYDHFCFDSNEHVSFLLENYAKLVDGSYEDTMGDVKHLVIVFENICDRLFTEEGYLRDVFIYSIDGMSQSKIAEMLKEKYDMELSQQTVSTIIKKTIPNMIINLYKQDKEDYVFTSLIHGKYKECKKCKQNIIASPLNYRKDSKGKLGYRATCKKCESIGKQ